MSSARRSSSRAFTDSGDTDAYPRNSQNQSLAGTKHTKENDIFPFVVFVPFTSKFRRFVVTVRR